MGFAKCETPNPYRTKLWVDPFPDGLTPFPNIGQEVQARITKEVDSGFSRRSFDKLDYTTFGELAVIIVSNWDVFGSIFSSRKAVERVLSNLNTLRNPIAHCAKLSEDEILRLQLTVKDWFRLME